MLSTNFTQLRGATRAVLFSLLLLPLIQADALAWQGGSMACNDLVQVSLDISCQADITPDMILEGQDNIDPNDFSVSISGVVGTIVSTPGMYTVTVTEIATGNSCWGDINVEDKLAPLVEECPCPPGNTDPNCQFLCTDLPRLLDGTIIPPLPLVSDNCGSFTSVVTDNVFDGAQCGDKILTRTYVYTDDSGNVSDPCVSEFLLSAPDLNQVTAPTFMVSLPCGSDLSMTSIYDYYLPLVGSDQAYMNAYPTVNGVPIIYQTCNLIASKTDLPLVLCDPSCSNSTKIIRSWTVLDWCNTTFTEFTQIVKSEDNEAPTIVANDFTKSTDPWGCAANILFPHPDILHDDCTESVDYTIIAPPGIQIVGSSNSGYTALNVPKGTYIFTYQASDCCGNVANDPVNVEVYDGASPVAVALQNIVVSLTASPLSNGVAKIFANSVDNGSHDGCTDVHFELRRDSDPCEFPGNTTYNADGHPQDGNPNVDTDGGAFVKFCCEDLTDFDENGINYGIVKVWMRVWDDGDMNGTFGSAGDNYNEIWVNVRVEDKLPPVVHCPNDITIHCDQDINDLEITGHPTVQSTCGDHPTEYTDTPFTNPCGIGFVIRRFNVVGANGSFCTQRIDVEGDAPFNGNINWPGDITTNCLSIPQTEPTWTAGPCDLIAYSVESDTFQFEDGVCYKIINNITVIDWCIYEANNPNTGGIWTHVQIIKVVDDVAPEILCEDMMYNADDSNDVDGDGNTCEAVNLVLTNTATDDGDCASDWLKWVVAVDLWGDGNDDYIFSSFLPPFNPFYVAPTKSGDEVQITMPEDIDGSMINHKIVWTVNDGCNNFRSCSKTFMVTDKKAPTPYCVSITTALMENGEVTLWACDFNIGSFDNCTSAENLRYTFTAVPPEADPLYDENRKCSSMVFDCEDLPNGIFTTKEVSMYVWDEKGNYNLCNISLTLVDNQGGCGGGTFGRVAGNVVTPIGEMVDQVEIDLLSEINDLSNSMTTSADGAFDFDQTPMHLDYAVSGSKDGDDRNGISTLDLVHIQRHILGSEMFHDAYKIIAADVNSDEKVSASDLIYLRKLILGVDASFAFSPSWIFIDQAQIFDNEDHPWPLFEFVAVNDLESDMMDAHLTAIKIGDVNNSVTANVNSANSEVRSTLDLDLTIADQYLIQGEEVRIPVMAGETTSLSGLQLSLEHSNLNLKRIEGGLLSLSGQNYHVTERATNFSWISINPTQINEGDVLFTLVAVPQKNTKVSDVVSIYRSGLKAEYYDDLLNIGNLDILFTAESIEEVQTVGMTVIGNSPNPFSSLTTLKLSLEIEGAVSLKVYDATGRSVHQLDLILPKGASNIEIEGSQLGAPGIYYCQLKQGTQTVTQKLIYVEK